MREPSLNLRGRGKILHQSPMQEKRNSAIATGTLTLTEFPLVQYCLEHDDRTSYKWRNLRSGQSACKTILYTNWLKSSFESIDEELTSVVAPLLSLAPEYFAALLLPSSTRSGKTVLARVQATD